MEVHPCFWRTAGTLGQVYKRAKLYLPDDVRLAYVQMLLAIQPYFLPSGSGHAALRNARPEVGVRR